MKKKKVHSSLSIKAIDFLALAAHLMLDEIFTKTFNFIAESLTM